MFIQVLFFIFVILVYWILMFSTIDNKRLHLIFFVSVLLILQSGLRGVSVGADTYGYMEQFLNVADMSWDEVWNHFYDVYINKNGKDAGYLLFVKVFQALFPLNYQLYLFFVAVLFFVAFGRFLYKNTRNCNEILLAVVLYQAVFYGFMSITGIRQTIAMAFCLFAFEYLKENKWWRFFFVIIISSFIHKSSIAFFAAYFICKIPSARLGLILSTLGAILLFPFGRSFAAFLVDITGTDNYSTYVNSTYETEGAQTFAILMLIILLGLFVYGDLMQKSNDKIGIYMKIFSLGILFTPFTWIDPSMMRLVQYFSIFMLLLLPSIYTQIELINRPFGKVIYLLTLLFFVFITIHRNNYYVFFWNDNTIFKV